MPETYEGVEVRRLPDGPEPEPSPNARMRRKDGVAAKYRIKEATGKVQWWQEQYKAEDWPKESKGAGRRRRRRQRQEKRQQQQK